MKYIVIVPDGAADYPIDILEGRTPLEVAETPFIDNLAKNGILGRVKTVPENFTPSSDVANLSLLGYEPQKYYFGRGPLEAANLGIDLEENDLAFRCNLITEAEGKIIDYSAGHITDKEAKILIEELNKNLATENIKFFAGKSYRHLLIYKDGAKLELDKLRYFAPHDIMNRQIKDYLPSGKSSQIVVELMLRSKEILSKHQINQVRVDLGENPANMIWLWGCGSKPAIPTFKERFGLDGAIISAVDLINGIGRLIGFEIIKVEGANAYYDTNYKGKAQAALEALERVDFVFVHIEATDEAGHNQDLRMKITCIERIDKFVVGTILEGLKNKDYRILIAPDHATPISKRTHTNEPVPFVIFGKNIKKGNFSHFCEAEALSSDLFFESGTELLKYFLSV
ncbi:MAG: cofactor-independent phosphoglycerate mutase [Candidatus Omnitrophica bacterium]|nr:cofactor-independent phosphoglycerate mutase [Candidatus Omnitrophota bacterium]